MAQIADHEAQMERHLLDTCDEHAFDATRPDPKPHPTRRILRIHALIPRRRNRGH
ncbi:hypothetical protein [Streptomyces sp. H39-C1]|uniref:hypothetical protein n=1 Tax=Streptomyces sp. H39-C1 TaxID=3004355 RepID=UPI0022B02A8F|nr:hypothetical protein [Streptomyces sp. H39-C1]MCZ4103456.1 hypothetical protein [Streptomyces sp. H39-C1]